MSLVRRWEVIYSPNGQMLELSQKEKKKNRIARTRALMTLLVKCLESQEEARHTCQISAGLGSPPFSDMTFFFESHEKQ